VILASVVQGFDVGRLRRSSGRIRYICHCHDEVARNCPSSWTDADGVLGCVAKRSGPTSATMMRLRARNKRYQKWCP
jgi:hypothetical protein